MSGHRRSRSSSTRPASYGDWLVGRTLGQGEFGKVKEARNAVNGKKAALKIINKSKMTDSGQKMTVRELTLLKFLHHSNICELYEHYEDEKELVLVMELCEGGESFDFLIAHGRLKEREARKFFRQMISGLAYCHSLHIIHRDLKLENILLDSDLNVKISDFGFANYFQTTAALTTYCGSPNYASPEIISSTPYTGPEVDIWSAGVVIYVLVAGRMPFEASDIGQLFTLIKAGSYKERSFFSDEFKDLIARCLDTNAATRITMEELVCHPWTTSNGEYDPVAIPVHNSSSDPIQHDIVNLMTEMGYDKMEILSGLSEDKMTDATRAYHMFVASKKQAVEMRNGSSEDASAAGNTDAAGPSDGAAAGTDDASPFGTLGAPPAKKSGSKRRSHRRSHTVDITSQEISDLRTSGPKGAPIRPQTPNTPAVLPPINEDGKDSNTSPPAPRQRRGSRSGAVPIPPPSVTSPLTLANGDAPVSPSGARAPSTRGGRRPGSGGQREAFPATLSYTGEMDTDRGKRPSTANRVSALREEAPPPASGSRKARGHRRRASYAQALDTDTAAEKRKAAFETRTSPEPVAEPSGGKGHGRKNSVTSWFKQKMGIDEGGDGAGGSGDSPAAAATSPTATDSGEPRAMRFVFGVTTTSSLPPDQLAARLLQAAADLGIETERDGWLVTCSGGQGGASLEVEICSIPRLSMYGFRLRRLSGDAWAYKQTCQDLIGSMDLES